MAKRKRRAFTKEFKAETVRLVRDSGKSVGAIARELDLTETALRDWVRQAEVNAGRGAPGRGWTLGWGLRSRRSRPRAGQRIHSATRCLRNRSESKAHLALDGASERAER